jgi:hypothetical protein
MINTLRSLTVKTSELVLGIILIIASFTLRFVRAYRLLFRESGTLALWVLGLAMLLGRLMIWLSSG